MVSPSTATMVSVSGDSDDESARRQRAIRLSSVIAVRKASGTIPRYAAHQLARCSEAIAWTSDGDAALIATRVGGVPTGRS